MRLDLRHWRRLKPPHRAPAGGAGPDTITPHALHEQRSLFGEILDWMLAPLLLLWPVSVVLTWLVAQGIAHKPFDRELGERVRLLAQHVTVEARDKGRLATAFKLSGQTAALLGSTDTETRHFQVLGTAGEFIGGERMLPRPVEEETLPVGLMRFRDDELDGQPVRVASLIIQVPGLPANALPMVQVAETLDKRSRLATEIIKGVMLPQFVMLPLAVLLVWLALARGIAPLNELQQRIRRRDSHDLSPIDDRDAPEEVSPLVRAINDLLARLDRSISTQKHFLADAAHQLKTPLAGLRTQAELAQREIDAGQLDPQALKKSLQQIARSSQRAAHMVHQLLSMARAENAAQVAGPPAINLARLAMETVRELVPRALDKRIDLGYEGPEHSGRGHAAAAGLLVKGQPVLLRELIRNLVDNALNYTPPGGTVTVRLVDDPFGQVVVLQVEDSGPGIPATEREKVFQPFYRALGTNVDGSGLGLAIVAEIAAQHGGQVFLEDANLRARPASPGARFTVRFPATRPEPADDAEPPAA